MFGGDEATPNYKKFFNFIKSTKCERTNVAPLKRERFLHHDTTTKANILNQQFASICTEEDMDNLPELGISSTPEMNKIFQASLDQGQIPSDWKQARVAPVFKKGDRA